MGRKSSHDGMRAQFAAAPYRIGPDGRLEVLLVTSRETGRWVIPKGWPIKKLGPLGTALREAYEEAGVRGAGGRSLGAFNYLKVLKKGALKPCEVEVFPLRVVEELDEWPEMDERERRWFTPEEASRAVNERRLSEILKDLPGHVAEYG